MHLDRSLYWQFTCGFFWGCLRWRTGQIWAPIFAHMVNNAIVALVAFGSG
jgi:membrane protease YdiL (CAAX protease family)